MKLSRTVTYALQATFQLAETGDSGPVPSKRLALMGDMPERFLLQVLRNLVTHGLLRSTRGVDGGYVLVRSPDEISVLDVVEAVYGPVNGDDKLECPERIHDHLRDALNKIALTTREQLSAIKLSHLLDSTEKSCIS